MKVKTDIARFVMVGISEEMVIEKIDSMEEKIRFIK